MDSTPSEVSSWPWPFAILLPGGAAVAQSPASPAGTGPALEGTTWAVTAVAGLR